MHQAQRRLSPHDWIDQQRQAGTARGNIFEDILMECAARRAERVVEVAEKRAAPVRRLDVAGGVQFLHVNPFMDDDPENDPLDQDVQ